MNYEWYCGYLTDKVKQNEVLRMYLTGENMKQFVRAFRPTIEKDGDYIPSKRELDAVGIWFDASISNPDVDRLDVFAFLPGAIQAAHAKDPRFMRDIARPDLYLKGKHNVLAKLNVELTVDEALKGEATAECTATAECEVRHPEKWETVYQGEALNALSKMSDKQAVYDELSGIATIKSGRQKLTISNSVVKGRLIGKIGAKEHMFYALMGAKYMKTGRRHISGTVEEYQELRGLASYQAAYRELTEVMQNIYDWSYRAEQKVKGKTKNYGDVRAIYKKGIRNHFWFLDLTPEQETMYQEAYQMYLSTDYWATDLRLNPHKPYLLRKVTEHKRMNIGKKNEDLISVLSLLKACPDIPSYDEVRKSAGRGVAQRIIEPFERDMDACNGTFNWHYCHSNGQLLSAEELDAKTYGQFASYLVRIYWNDDSGYSKENKPKPKRKRHPRHP